MIAEELSMLGKLLTVSSLRHQVISHNIANLNTPGFARKTVAFEELLDQAQMQQTINNTQAKVVESKEQNRLDGNSSSLEREMQYLTANSLRYEAYLQAISYKIKSLEGAITGRSQ
jgi:flagellar basal-body rod protein FlgB